MPDVRRRQGPVLERIAICPVSFYDGGDFFSIHQNNNDMNIYTVENLQGVNYEVLGVVTGSTIQSKNVFSDIGQSLKNIVGGELKAYTQMMEKARKMSTDRMIAQAEAMQADAVIGVRYATSAIMAQAAEVLVYGTAIRYK
jgi:uncharacterized protein YbjQ (UPF0145 family)